MSGQASSTCSLKQLPALSTARHRAPDSARESWSLACSINVAPSFSSTGDIYTRQQYQLSLRLIGDAVVIASNIATFPD
jgi:hypothetical protein